MARKSGTRIKTIEKLCLLWVTLFTFCVGLAIVLPAYPSGFNQNLILLLYIFLEILPLLLFSYTVSQPSLRSSFFNYLLSPVKLINVYTRLFKPQIILAPSFRKIVERNLCFVVHICCCLGFWSIFA